MATDTFSKRFAELAAKSETLESRRGDFRDYVSAGDWEGWATSCQNLIKIVFGADSPHYTNFTGVAERCTGSEDQVQSKRRC